MVRPPKPQSAKAKAAKAKREKIAASDVRERVEESYDRAWNPRTLMESAYPSSMKQEDILTAEEALAAEEQLLGKRGDVFDDGSQPFSPSNDDMNDTPFRDDEMPEFLQTAVKAGPVRSDSGNLITANPAPLLDHLGRTPKERKERKITDAIALGDKSIPQRAVTILRDHDLEHPDLYMAIYVAGDWAVRDDEARFARLFSRSGCYKADTVEDADLVIFGGGSDVEPLLYGENNADRFPSTYYDEKRDAADIQIYLQCRNQGTPMMGVCRGAQFLHVMNGGKLYQDIDGHQGSHKAFALREKTLIEKVSSVHHQACIFNKEMEVLLTTSSVATTRWLDRDRKDTAAKLDIEGFYYRDTGCFGVQGHPEYAGYNKFSVWCLEQISNLFLTSPDFTWEGKRLRMTKEAKDAKEIASQYIQNAYNNTTEV